MFKRIKTVIAYIKWSLSSKNKLLKRCKRLRIEALSGKFKEFDKTNGICVNVESDYISVDAIRHMYKIMSDFVRDYPHPEGTKVDKNWFPHVYPVEGNTYTYTGAAIDGTLWTNPRRLQLLDYIIDKLESEKP